APTRRSPCPRSSGSTRRLGRQAGKETQLDKLGTRLVFAREPFKSLIECEEIVVAGVFHDGQAVQVEAFPVSAPLEAFFVPAAGFPCGSSSKCGPAVHGPRRNNSPGGKGGGPGLLLPPPLSRSVRRVGPLAVTASQAAAWRPRFIWARRFP